MTIVLLLLYCGTLRGVYLCWGYQENVVLQKKERKNVDIKGTWLLYNCCMTVVWLLYDCCMVVVWLLYGCYCIAER